MAPQSNRAMRPFWMHQVVEYIIGASFISTAIASSTPTVPIVLGGIVLINAAVAIGPAGAFRLVHRQVHRILDLVIMGLIVLAAIQPIYEVENSTRLLMLALGLVMAFVWWNSDFATREQRKQRRGSGSTGVARATGRAAGAKGAASGSGASKSGASKSGASKSGASAKVSDSEAAGRSAGRSAAQTYLAAKRLKKAMVDDRRGRSAAGGRSVSEPGAPDSGGGTRDPSTES